MCPDHLLLRLLICCLQSSDSPVFKAPSGWSHHWNCWPRGHCQDLGWILLSPILPLQLSVLEYQSGFPCMGWPSLADRSRTATCRDFKRLQEIPLISVYSGSISFIPLCHMVFGLRPSKVAVMHPFLRTRGNWRPEELLILETFNCTAFICCLVAAFSYCI